MSFDRYFDWMMAAVLTFLLLFLAGIMVVGGIAGYQTLTKPETPCVCPAEKP